jgi:hypothetical protein
MTSVYKQSVFKDWTVWIIIAFALALSPILPRDRGGWWTAITICIALSVGLLLSVLVWTDTRHRRRQIADRLLTIKQRLIENPEDTNSQNQFRESLDSTSIFERFYALYTLGDLYELLQGRRQSTSALDGLLLESTRSLGHDNIFVRNAAAQTFSRIGTDARFAIDKLAYTLQSYPHEGAGLYSAIALGNIGEATPAVLEALRIVDNIPQALAYSKAHAIYMRFTRSDLDHGINRSI